MAAMYKNGYVLDYTVPNGVTINNGDVVSFGTNGEFVGIAQGYAVAGQTVGVECACQAKLPCADSFTCTQGLACALDNDGKVIIPTTAGTYYLIGFVVETISTAGQTTVGVALVPGGLGEKVIQ